MTAVSYVWVLLIKSECFWLPSNLSKIAGDASDALNVN